MFRAFLFIYSVLYTITLLFYVPVRMLKAAVRDQKLALLERFERLPSPHSNDRGEAVVWVHAVSVGEVNAAKALIESLAGSGFEIYISTTTQTGQEHARKSFRGKTHVFYFPLDWKFLCRKYLGHIQPDAVLLMETEIWPNFLITAKTLKIPVFLVNGRISDRSFRQYKSFRFLIRPLLRCFSHFCMQSEQDLERIRELGAPRERTICTGNLKFDYSLEIDPEKEDLKRSIAELLKPRSEDLLLICGSTKPGEEEVLLSIFEKLGEEFPQLRLLLAPRHPHRGDSIATLAKARGFRYLQRSRDPIDAGGASPRLLILDSIGELASIYGIGDLVFVGGSLVPEGGQNLIEAAAYGKPILFGPHMENFREVAKSFVDAGAALQLPDSEHLKSELRNLIHDAKRREDLGQKAKEVIDLNRGAVESTLETIGICLRRRITDR